MMKNSKQNDFVCALVTYFFILLVGISFLAGADSLIQQVTATRNASGGIIISGKTTLPKGTALMIDISRSGRLLGQSKVTVNEQGSFSSVAFTDKGKPHASGVFKTTITSYFTKIWQLNEVLSKVGENGANLPPGQLVPDDPEFPKAGGHLEASFDINFPGISPELQAIQMVKDAVLTLPDEGRSADPIKDVVSFFEQGRGFKALDWSAKQSPDGFWVITLNCMDAGKKKQAQWGLNPKTKAVKYLDPLAKSLSWTPKE